MQPLQLVYNHRWSFLSVIYTENVTKINRAGNTTYTQVVPIQKTIAKLSKNNEGKYQIDMIEDKKLKTTVLTFLKQNKIEVEENAD